jgi:anti-sigma B factor antagonist
MSELQVEARELEGVLLLYPRGFVNAHTVRLFEGEIQKALDQQRYRIVVNCAGLKYIASAGLGALMGVIEEVRQTGGGSRT